jgi:hypothetical protein
VKSWLRRLLLRAVAIVVVGSGAVDLYAATKHYVLTNDDVAGPNTATVFLVKGTPTNPKLTPVKVIQTGGQGLGGGTYGTVRQALARVSTTECFFVADANSNDIAAIDYKSLKVVGNYQGSTTDDGARNGIGVATRGKHLYASFITSGTVGAFSIQADCSRSVLGYVSAVELTVVQIDGLASHGSILVVTYTDGSIESFNTAGGVPVPNNDKQYTSGFNKYHDINAADVNITQDGHFAVFSDASVSTQVEVSNISSGKLKPTVDYDSLGSGKNSNNMWLSPDESLIYVSNNQSGQITALFFDKKTGKVSYGCISSALKGFNSTWFTNTGVTTEDATGTGAVLWLAEEGSASLIGIVNVTSTGKKCMLKEAAKYPAKDQNSQNLESLTGYTQRSF